MPERLHPKEIEVDKKHVLRDTRPLSQKAVEFVMSPEMGAVIGVIGVISAFIPGAAPLALVLALPLFFASLKPIRLPYFLPMSSGMSKDPNDIDVQTGKPNRPRGIDYFGVDYHTGEQIWFTNGALRQHLLFLATTGGGKTASLTSLMWSPLIQGSGFAMVDGKADLDVAVRVMSLAHRVGRADDVLVINYLTGNLDSWALPDSQITNTFNFMSRGASSALIEIVRSLVDADKDIWGKRAEAAVSAFITPLVYLRDKKGLHLTVDVVRDYLSLEKLGTLLGDNDIPQTAKAELEAYILNLPGLKQSELEQLKLGQQIGNPTVYEQHGYITMQLIPALNELSGRFGHIFNAVMSEVDMEDVVLNNRILLVLLPALEKSEGSLANLGRIVVAALKSMMAGALGSKLEGDVHKNLENRPTASSTPFPTIFDEVGYYFVSGMAVAAAQARSIGFQVIYSAQDVPAMKRLGEKAVRETASVIGNTNIKIAGRLEEFDETLKVFRERAGQGYYSESNSLSKGDDGTGSGYYETGASMTRRDRLDPRVLAAFDEGQVFINFKDTLRRVDLFYAKPKVIRFVQLSRGLEVDGPSAAIVTRLKEDFGNARAAFKQVLQDPGTTRQAIPDEGHEEIQTLATRMAKAVDAGSGRLEAALVAMRSMPRQQAGFDPDRLFSELKSEEDEHLGVATEAGPAGEHASLGEAIRAAGEEISEADDPFGGKRGAREGVTAETADAKSGAVRGAGEAGIRRTEKGKVSGMSEAEAAMEDVAPQLEDVFSSGAIDREELKTNLAQANRLSGLSASEAESAASDGVARVADATRYPTAPTPNNNPEQVVSIINDIIAAMDDDEKNEGRR